MSAALLAPIALICIWLGDVPFAVMILAGTVGMLFEWHDMVRTGSGSGGSLLTGSVYILLAATALTWLRFAALVGRDNVLFLLLLVWSSDIGAYAAGRAVGGPKLAPRISPGKTVSGAIGGLLAAVLVGVAAATMASTPPLRAGIVAGMLGLVAQAGDLLESFAKRRFGVKDSGRLIPGHGGLLDRLDALLAVALAAGLLVLFEGRGGVLWQ
jgi:phosphatidate cytidylyltransferase